MTNKESLEEYKSIQNMKNSNDDEVTSTTRGICRQIFVTGAILILAAACGMPIGYSAVLLPQLYNSTEPLKIDVEIGSWIASVHSLATPIGSFVSGPIADRFGRRPGLLLSIFPLIIGWSLLAISQSHISIIIGRIIAGFAVGLIGAPAQVLIAEISIPKIRGILIGAPFVSYSLGILFVYALGSKLHWRIVAWCGNILPIISGLAIFFIPESPIWLARNGNIDLAQKYLIWFRDDKIQAKKELNILLENFKNEKNYNNNGEINETFLNLCLKKSSIKPLLIINIFHLLQILSGTFLFVFYAVDIITDFGIDINKMDAAVMTAIVRLICTIIFCFLLLYIKRRYMIIICGIGSGICSLILGIFILIRYYYKEQLKYDIYFLCIFILFYIAFNTGFLIMPGIMIGELLPVKIRGRIAGYIFALFNLSLFIIAKIFPLLQYLLKIYGLFIMFSISSFIASIFMYIFLPETKGKTLTDIENYFNKKSWFWLKNIKNNNNKNLSCENDNKIIIDEEKHKKLLNSI